MQSFDAMAVIRTIESAEYSVTGAVSSNSKLRERT